jgi:pimeloyl-ACP methyl ester carboxylesterase
MTARTDVDFPSGASGERCRAWLYQPEITSSPVILMAHGLGATKDMRLDAFAERFAAAGYSCLVFDYRHFGQSDGEPRQLLDIARQLQDWSAAITFARSDSRLSASPLILWGTSFGGGHVIATAARHPEIAAAIAQCPFTDGIASALAMDFRSSLKVTVRAIRDMVASWLRLTPAMIATAGPPHSAALMTAPDAQPGYFALVPDGSGFRNEVAARFGLQILRYRPGRDAARVASPILFCTCEADTVAPAGPTKRYAARAPRGESLLYAEGHFDIYVGAAFEKVVADQLAFLQRHVPARALASRNQSEV